MIRKIKSKTSLRSFSKMRWISVPEIALPKIANTQNHADIWKTEKKFSRASVRHLKTKIEKLTRLQILFCDLNLDLLADNLLNQKSTQSAKLSPTSSTTT